jgi:Family of unknown function (DUF6527)
MAKVWTVPNNPHLFIIECPACGYGHPFSVGAKNESGAQWSFNGDLEKPTFRPSMLVGPNTPKSRCHSFVTDGKIQFLPDSWHNRSDTVDLPDVDEEEV